jgi:hypothetical protein
MAIALPLIVPAGEAIAAAAAVVGSAIVAAAGIHAAATAIDKEFATDRPAAAKACPQALTKEPPPDCAQLVARMEARIAELKQRHAEMLQDQKGLYAVRPKSVPPYGSWPGHITQYKGKQTNLARMISEAQAKGCPVPADAEEWATRPAPAQPQNPGGPR